MINTVLHSVEVTEERPDASLAITSFQYGLGYAGREVHVLSSACDVWIGADKVAAWRDAIPVWRRIRGMSGGAISFYSFAPAFITTPDGNFVAPSFPTPYGQQNVNVISPTVALPAALKDAYLKFARCQLNNVATLPTPVYLPNGWDNSANAGGVGWNGITGNPLNNGIPVPSIVQQGPTFPRLFFFQTSNINQSAFLAIDNYVAGSFTAFPYASSVYGVGANSSYLIALQSASIPAQTSGDLFLALTTGIKGGVAPTSIFNIWNSGAPLATNAAYPILYIPLPFPLVNTTSINGMVDLVLEFSLPNWPLVAGHDCWVAAFGWRRTGNTGAISVNSNWQMGLALPGMTAPAGATSNAVQLTP